MEIFSPSVQAFGTNAFSPVFMSSPVFRNDSAQKHFPRQVAQTRIAFENFLRCAQAEPMRLVRIRVARTPIPDRTERRGDRAFPSEKGGGTVQPHGTAEPTNLANARALRREIWDRPWAVLGPPRPGSDTGTRSGICGQRQERGDWPGQRPLRSATGRPRAQKALARAAARSSSSGCSVRLRIPRRSSSLRRSSSEGSSRRVARITEIGSSKIGESSRSS